MMNNETILTATNIHKSYPMGKNQSLEVLKGVDVHISRGEILVIVGHSGAGKSTLLHILGALDRPTKGEVEVGGKSVSKMNDTALARFRNQRYGFVFQFHHLLPEFTALENVTIPGLIARKSKEETTETARKLLADVGLSNRLDHKPSELSGGEQQRVAFARALINDPVMVMADEPSGNLDLKNSQALHELMWQLVKEHNKTFVVVTHNQDLADKADRTIELYDGTIKQS